MMMNRPKIDDYVDLELKLTEEGTFDYITDLISYCDELESAIDKAVWCIVNYPNFLESTKKSEAEWREWFKEEWR